jgi:hypothetical protein
MPRIIDETFLQYLQRIQADHVGPSEFVVVYEDYSNTYIPDIRRFDLGTLRKKIIGVTFAMHDDQFNSDKWQTWFEDPFGGTIIQNCWKKARAIKYIGFRHSRLMNKKMRQHVQPPVEAFQAPETYTQ